MSASSAFYVYTDRGSDCLDYVFADQYLFYLYVTFHPYKCVRKYVLEWHIHWRLMKCFDNANGLIGYAPVSGHKTAYPLLECMYVNNIQVSPQKRASLLELCPWGLIRHVCGADQWRSTSPTFPAFDRWFLIYLRATQGVLLMNPSCSGVPHALHRWNHNFSAIHTPSGSLTIQLPVPIQCNTPPSDKHFRLRSTWYRLRSIPIFRLESGAWAKSTRLSRRQCPDHRGPTTRLPIIPVHSLLRPWTRPQVSVPDMYCGASLLGVKKLGKLSCLYLWAMAWTTILKPCMAEW